MRKNKRKKYSSLAHRWAMLQTWTNAALAGDIPAIRAARLRVLGLSRRNRGRP